MSNSANMLNFTDVDNSGKSDFFIKSIDNYSTLDMIKGYKQKTIQIQDIKRGFKVLDVGCGTGEDISAIGSIVGNEGLAVGTDLSCNLLEGAKKRHLNKEINLEFKVGDAHKLEFEDNFFDCSRADLVFHFLERPNDAFLEMIRVTKKGGSILVVNADFDSLLIDSEDVDLTRKIIHFRSDNVKNGWISRQLYRMFKENNLQNIILEPVTLTVTKYNFALMLFDLENVVNMMIDANLIKKSEGVGWTNNLKEKDDKNIFFSSITGFIVAGNK